MKSKHISSCMLGLLILDYVVSGCVGYVDV